MSELKVAVKVGKTSNIHIANCKAYRAITLDELEMIVSNDSDIKLVVIEGIYESEQNQTRQFIKNYTSIEGNNIVFYITDKDEKITSGIADEFEYNIAMTREALHIEIERLTGVNVSTKINWKESNTKDVQVTEENTTIETESEHNFENSNTEHTDKGSEFVEHELSADSREVDELKKENARLTNIVDGLTDKISELNSKLEYEKEKSDDLEISSDNNASAVDEYVAEIDELKDSIEELRAELEKSRLELTNKTEEYNKLEDTYNNKILEYNTLESKSKELEDKVRNIEDKLSNVEEEFSVERHKYEDRVAELEGINNEISRKYDETTKQLSSDIDEANDKLKIAEEEIRSKDKLVIDKDSIISELYNDKNELERQINDNEELKTLQVEYEKLKINSEATQVKLDSLNDRYNDLLNDIGGDISVVNAIKSDNDMLTSINQQMKEKIIELESKCETLQGDNKRLNTSINTLKENSERLRETVELSSKVGGAADDPEVPAIKYEGKGKIINIFGHGSYGITTTAMSIADRLGQSHKVCIIDLDITSPSIDQWTRKSPYVKEVVGLEMRLRTGLGVFIKQGYDSFMSSNGMVQTIKGNKAGTIDCIYGLYASVQSRDIAMANYSKLFEYVGNNYEYIIIDSGRTGESIVHDSLINSVCNIAHKNVYVVNALSIFHINSAIVKLKNSKIDISRVMIFLNLCTNSGISPQTKQLLSGMTYEIMHADTSLVFKERAYFNEYKLTREKFEAVISEVL